MSSILFLTNRFYEYLYVIAISTYKFLFAGPVAVTSGFDYWETVISLSLGGLFGFFLFYFFSAEIIHFYNKFFPPKPHAPRAGWMKRYRRRLALKKYGLPLLLFFGPLLLSLPLTAFIVRRWFSDVKNVIVYFCFSIVLWAFVFGILTRFNILK